MSFFFFNTDITEKIDILQKKYIYYRKIQILQKK